MIGLTKGQEQVVAKSKLTEGQIAFAPKQAEPGTSVEEPCRGDGHQPGWALRAEEEL
jgi:hypothetical protein